MRPFADESLAQAKPLPEGRAAGRAPPLWVVPVVLLPAVLALPFLRGQVLLFRDILHFSLPQQAFAARALAQGRLPLWNPLVYGGAPFFAEPGAGVLYPPNWLFLALPPAQAATGFVLVHLPIAAWGMRLLARACGLSPGAAALAATSYVASGYLLSMHGGHYYFASAALLPLCAALLVRCAQGGGARGLILAAASVLALLLNGEAQALAFAALLAAALALDGGAGRGLPLALGRLSAALALGLALAAVQAVPTALFLAGTVRGRGLALEEAAHWALHPLRLIELLVPEPFGLPWLDNGYWGPLSAAGAHHLPWAVSLWLGPSALLLAPLALLGRGRARAATACLAALSLLLAAGARTPLFALWARAVPLMGRFRYPEKYALLATAALALLGAQGLDKAGEDSRARRLALGLFGLASALLLAAAAWMARAPAGVLDAVSRGLEAAQANLPPAAALQASTFAFAQAGALSLALALALAAARTRPGWLSPIFVLAGGLAGAVHGLPLLSYGDGAFLRTPPRLAAEARAAAPAGSTGRTFAEGTCAFRARGEGPLLEELRRFQWETGKENFLTLFGVPEVLGYGALEAADRVAEFRALSGGGRFAAERAFGAAVALGCDASGRPRARPVEGALPRLRYLPAFAGQAGAGGGLSAGAAALLDDRPESVRVRADGAGGVLVLADAFAPGWTAAIDGRPAQLLRAPPGFRAVALSPGRHEVAFSYTAPGLRLGAGLSAAAAALCALLLAREKKARGLSSPGPAPVRP